MQSLDPLFARLSRSKFRSRFRLGMKERQYCLEKGAPVIEQHAADFVAKRLAPAGNDSNLLIVFYVQIIPDDFVMQLHR
ncbi:DUF4186 family protein, partial [Shigella sonnei]